MKIKAFSFEKSSFALATVKQNVISKIDGASVYFESFSDANTLFGEISAALENSEVLLIGVESSFYLKFKPVLIKAFNFTPAYSEKIKKAIDSTSNDEKLIKAHSLVPNESVELISDNGLFSGFYVKSEDQYIVVFPLIEECVPKMLENSGLPFFKKPESKPSVYEDIASKDKASEKAQNIVNKLAENEIKLSIPTTPAAKTLKEDIKNCENYESGVLFTPFVNDDGVSNPKEYAAQLSKGALDLRNCDIGAAISNIFREKKGDSPVRYYSFISISTKEKTVVKKLLADAGENVDNLIIEATNELYSMIDKYLDEVIFKKSATEEEKEKYEKSLIEAEYQADEKSSKRKRNTIIAIIIVAVAAAVCILLGLKFDGYFVNASDAPEANVLQIGNKNNIYLAPISTSTSESSKDYASNTKPNEIVEYVSTDESTTSIFDVVPNSTLIPVTETGNNVINYTPNTNKAPVTEKEDNTTTKKKEEEEKTTQKTTQKPTEKPTQKPTQPKETETQIEVVAF